MTFVIFFIRVFRQNDCLAQQAKLTLGNHFTTLRYTRLVASLKSKLDSLCNRATTSIWYQLTWYSVAYYIQVFLSRISWNICTPVPWLYMVFEHPHACTSHVTSELRDVILYLDYHNSHQRKAYVHGLCMILLLPMWAFLFCLFNTGILMTL